MSNINKDKIIKWTPSTPTPPPPPPPPVESRRRSPRINPASPGELIKKGTLAPASGERIKSFKKPKIVIVPHSDDNPGSSAPSSQLKKKGARKTSLPIFNFEDDYFPTWFQPSPTSSEVKTTIIPAGSESPPPESVPEEPITLPAPPSPQIEKLVSHENLIKILDSVDPGADLEKDVGAELETMADSFLEQLLEGACRLAKHRGSDKLGIGDVGIYLERNQNMKVSLGPDGEVNLKRMETQLEQNAHHQRMELLNRSLMKY